VAVRRRRLPAAVYLYRVQGSGQAAWRGVASVIFHAAGGAKPSRACEIDGGRVRSTTGRLCMRFSVTAAAPLRAASQPASLINNLVAGRERREPSAVGPSRKGN